MNGFNDIGAFEDSSIEIRLSNLDSPSQVILFGTPNSGSGHFYMDMLEGDRGNQVDVLNLAFYEEGSNYVFADGSARFIRKADYEKDGYGNKLWLINKDFVVR
jgi:prepilin-type processing-associated H-X9-DG protein